MGKLFIFILKMLNIFTTILDNVRKGGNMKKDDKHLKKINKKKKTMKKKKGKVLEEKFKLLIAGFLGAFLVLLLINFFLNFPI